MIERYTRPVMGAIWDLENKFEIWKQIEVLACEAQAELGVVPAKTSRSSVIVRASRWSASRSLRPRSITT